MSQSCLLVCCCNSVPPSKDAARTCRAGGRTHEAVVSPDEATLQNCSLICLLCTEGLEKTRTHDAKSKNLYMKKFTRKWWQQSCTDDTVAWQSPELRVLPESPLQLLSEQPRVFNLAFPDIQNDQPVKCKWGPIAIAQLREGSWARFHKGDKKCSNPFNYDGGS